MKNILYFKNINSIGGVESMFFYLAKKYQDFDITIYYSTGDFKQIQRLARYVRVKQYKSGEVIKCDKAFFNYSTDIIDFVEAKEYIQIIHCDYAANNLTPHTNPKITKYIGVGKNVCETFTRLTGEECELCYNPIVVEKPKKVLRLISATRLTPEKGKSRMIKLADMLDAAGIPFIWTVFTNDTNAINNPSVAFMKPRLDIIDFIADADYLVQLSDTEGYSYSIIEALCVGTPVIVTDLPMLKEAGVVNGKNGFILNMDMTEVPLDAICDGLQAFEYKPKADGWAKLLAKGKSTYKADLKTLVTVKATQDYLDLEMNKIIRQNDAPYQITKVRADHLVGLGLVTIVDGGTD